MQYGRRMGTLHNGCCRKCSMKGEWKRYITSVAGSAADMVDCWKYFRMVTGRIERRVTQ